MKNRELISLVAVLGVTAQPLYASENEDLDRQALPESSASFGMGYVPQDNQFFGIYNGLSDEGLKPLLNIDYVSRDPATGRWINFSGNNLGLDTRALHFEALEQGNWEIDLRYDGLTRQHPYRINTGITGGGSGTVMIGGPTRDQEFEIQRQNGEVTLSKQYPGGFDVAINLRQERKDGERTWGVRDNNRALSFLLEPIDQTTNEASLSVGYTGDKFQLKGGYLFSGYTNDNEVLDVQDGTGASVAQVALPLDNEAHQLFLSGGYTFSPTTRGHFKISRSVATQDEEYFTNPDFASTPPLATDALGRTNLDGKVVSTLANFGLNMRPVSDLTLNAKLRYEERDDRTPRFQYISAGGRRDGFNPPFSHSKLNAGLDATYRLSRNYRIFGGYGYEEWDRSYLPVRQVSFRPDTDEDTFRIGVRRSMTDTVSGSISLSHSERGGDDYLPSGTGLDLIDPIHWGDRTRNKITGRINWMPTRQLDLQLHLDYSEDEYDGRPSGPIDGEKLAATLDTSYQISDEWQVTGWLSYSNRKFRQESGDPGRSAVYQSKLVDKSKSAGIGLRGSPRDHIKVGADLQYFFDDSAYNNTGGVLLPEIYYKQLALNLFMDYAIEEDAGVRLDVMYRKIKTDDWTWDTDFYDEDDDGTAGNNNDTTVYQDKDESGAFVGLTYYMKWR